MSENETTVGPEAAVSLREVTAKTVRAICELTVSESQNSFVADNAYSIAQAHFTPQAWFRAVYAGETPVGFIMLHDDVKEGKYYLWRFMIDARYQGMGFGRRAVELLVEYVRARPNATELSVSHSEGEGSPEGFYRELGFEHTGVKKGNELEMKLAL